MQTLTGFAFMYDLKKEEEEQKQIERKTTHNNKIIPIIVIIILVIKHISVWLADLLACLLASWMKCAEYSSIIHILMMIARSLSLARSLARCVRVDCARFAFAVLSHESE